MTRRLHNVLCLYGGDILLNPFLTLPSVFTEPLSYQEQFKLLYEYLKQITNSSEEELEKAISEWIEKNYNELFFNATYNPETETITIAKGGN